jgi:prepilin-type N-terminal cleavage/methylation domain-containing protein
LGQPARALYQSLTVEGKIMDKTMQTSTTHIARLLAESKGFTLIEIMVVIIILGLLATLSFRTSPGIPKRPNAKSRVLTSPVLREP